MDLRHALSACYRWRLVMVALFVLGVGTGAGYAALAPRSYSSDTIVYFSLTTSTGTGSLAQGSTYTQDVVKSYSQVVTTERVLQPVIQRLDLPLTTTQLARRVSVKTQPDTVLATITVTDADAAQAAKIANAVAGQLNTAILSLSAGGVGSPSAIQVTTISTASASRLPASPNVPLVLVLGVVLGVGLAVAAAVVLELLASPLVDDERAEADAHVIGKIVFDPRARSQPLPIISNPQGPRAESFRALRTNLRQLQGANSPQCLVITSALPGEGRTSVAVNLAITVAQAQRKVLLIDADLRNPAAAGRLGLSVDRGLSDLLLGEAKVEDVVRSMRTQTWRDSALLDVLPAGPRSPDPSELLARSAMSDLLDEARKRYDLVIVDTPALLPVTDAAMLAAQADGTILVVNARSTNERAFTEAQNALRLAGGQVSGVVLNAVRARRSHGTGSYLFGSRVG